MLHLGGDVHPAHRGFAEVINADFVSCLRPETSPHHPIAFVEEFWNGTRINDYDLLITEGARPLYAGLINKLVHGTKLVYLCAEHRFYEILERDIEVESFYTALKSTIGTYGIPAVKTIFRRGIDGVIAVSDLMAGYVREVVGPDTPIRVAHPFIEQEFYDDLEPIDYSQDSYVVTTVARHARYKGIDLLVEAWEKVRQTHSNAELQIIGDGHLPTYSSVPGVSVRGYVEDLAAAYAETGLYVQPSRIDAFPVASLEAMRAGIPTLVTDRTGVKSLVNDIDDKLVTNVDSSSIANQIMWFLSLGNEEKMNLSKQFRDVGCSFNPDARKKKFATEFEQILKEI